MSYTVLARKWRPKSFAELVGQSHVMQALANALDQQRLHHAYLFTGTRGVGKTTIARIFAKALNCQEGISSNPCGVCETCRSIDEGRFIDLIEVDAASKTKVDDTREMLDNVQFAPTQGRYKVYLIDEVHMLSKSSFNALLKTLEEPPEHVKFLLATTDPHKLPITVLSRCLQFNLMRLTQTQIQSHLANILAQENVAYEDAALALIAKSADGSARDSLSLLDQAIAYGAGEVMFEPVQTMLGLVDQQFGVAILQALANDDGNQLKEVIQQLAIMGVDYQALLSQLIESLHAISYVQVFADNETTTLLPAEIVQGFAANFAPERVQLLYQVALLTKQDMQLAPDIRIGFEMALMRMLAFQPPESKPSEVSSAGDKLSTKGVTNGSVTETAEISPMDALSSLASARSLVGKKNAPITPEPSKPLESQRNAQQQDRIEDTQTQSIKIKVEEASLPFVAQESGQATSIAEPSSSINTHHSELSQPESPGLVDSMPVNGFDTASHQSRISSGSESPAADNSAPVDHLAQIKERLKQPLGKFKYSPSLAAKDHAGPLESAEVNVISQDSYPTTISNAPQEDSLLNQIDNLAMQAEKVPAIEEPFSAQPSQQDAPPWPVDDSVSQVAQHSTDDLSNHSSNHLAVPEPMAVEHSVSNSLQISQSTTRLADEMPVEPLQQNFSASGDALKDWIDIISRLGLRGMAAEMARNSVLVELTDSRLVISIDPEQEYAKPDMVIQQIEQAAQQVFGAEIKLAVVESQQHFTPMKQENQLKANKQQAAQQAIEEDGIVQSLVSTLGMEVIPGSIKPI